MSAECSLRKRCTLTRNPWVNVVAKEECDSVIRITPSPAFQIGEEFGVLLGQVTLITNEYNSRNQLAFGLTEITNRSPNARSAGMPAIKP